MEKVALRSSSTRAKIIGTIASISGALVVVLCKGPNVLSSPHWTSPSVLLLQQPLALGSPQSNWVIGGLLLAMGYLFLFNLVYYSVPSYEDIPGRDDCNFHIQLVCGRFICTAVMSAIFLSGALYLGSVIGALILSARLYAVLWGKAKEEEMTCHDSGLSSSGPLSSCCKVPFVANHNDEEM
ncbi:hypothetical protein CRYUN_Cryun15aG0024500 [Craigia yunnanensis]